MDCKANENEIGKKEKPNANDEKEEVEENEERETTHNQDVECVRKIVSCYNTVRVLKYGFGVSGYWIE